MFVAGSKKYTLQVTNVISILLKTLEEIMAIG